jgi:hypothetical protein
MNIQRQPLIILLGMMTTMPVGGVVWQTLHYLIGLKRLGFAVHYVEDHGIYPAMLADSDDPEGAEKAARFLQQTLERFDLGNHWSYHAWHGPDRYYGAGQVETARLFGRATAVINLHGGTALRAEHRTPTLIYLETDPVAPEIELQQKLRTTEEFLDAHDVHFTFAENLGAADCKVPVPAPRYRFRPTRQPVVLDLWDCGFDGAAECFTTIANWRQPERPVTLDGEVYHWSKHHEFLKFLDLPHRTNQPFELALSSYEASDREMLEGNGWHVRSALEFTRDLDQYRTYIGESRGEWTVAKDQNVRLRSGWFSDRAATYLAAGRPVVTQETGFSNFLPTGSGLFAFTTMEETLDAIERINSDYGQHSRRAQEIAQECFSSDVVLPRLLEQAGIVLPQTSAHRT